MRAVLCAALLSFAAVASAGGVDRLDAALRSELAALPPLAGPRFEVDVTPGRPVVVSFFASWCPPCRVEFAHLNELAREFPSASLQIVAINVYEDFLEDERDRGRLGRFLAETSPRFSVLEGNESIRAAFGGIDRIPTLFVFGHDGAPVLRFVHLRGATKTNADLDELRAAVHAALGE